MENAISVLQYYFRTLYKAQGLTWDSDNDAEIAGIVQDIIEAAKADWREQR